MKGVDWLQVMMNFCGNFIVEIFSFLTFLENGTDETRTRNFRRDRAVL